MNGSETGFSKALAFFATSAALIALFALTTQAPVLQQEAGAGTASVLLAQVPGVTSVSNPVTPAYTYRGQNGRQFRYTCPAGVSASGSIWGTEVYTDDSSVCSAGVHMGVITQAAGGPVTIEIRAGQSSYVAATLNGVTSYSFGFSSGSFAVLTTATDTQTCPPGTTGTPPNCVTPTPVVSVDGGPSLSVTTGTPTISGSATNATSLIVRISPSDSNTLMYGNGDVMVQNGRWSVTVSPALINGNYFVRVYKGTTMLYNASLAVTNNSAAQICPPGTTGTPPNCTPVVPPQTCPAGQTGTYPNCVTPTPVTGPLTLVYKGKTLPQVTNISKVIAQTICAYVMDFKVSSNFPNSSCMWNGQAIELDPTTLSGTQIRFVTPAMGQNTTIPITGTYNIAFSDPAFTTGKYRMYLTKWNTNLTSPDMVYEATLSSASRDGATVYTNWNFTVDSASGQVPSGPYDFAIINTDSGSRGNVSAIVSLTSPITNQTCPQGTTGTPPNCSPVVVATPIVTVDGGPTLAFVSGVTLLSGSATNATSLSVSVAPLSGGSAVYTNNNISVTNGRWTFTVSPSLATGSYIARISSGSTLLYNATLNVTAVVQTCPAGTTGTYPNCVQTTSATRTTTCAPNFALGAIWGTTTYTDDSDVCTAALHAGVITRAVGGTVTTESRPGQSSYTSSTNNGVTSRAYGSWGGSFIVRSQMGTTPTVTVTGGPALSTTTGTPTISGAATNAALVKVVVEGATNGTVYFTNANVPVITNGSWRVSVSPALANGNYIVRVYVGTQLLYNATLAVQVPTSTVTETPTNTTNTVNTSNAANRVQVIVPTANVRSNPSPVASVGGTQSLGAQGTVGSAPVTAGGFTWYLVNFDSGVDGWTVSSNIQSASNVPTTTTTNTTNGTPVVTVDGGSTLSFTTATPRISGTATNAAQLQMTVEPVGQAPIFSVGAIIVDGVGRWNFDVPAANALANGQYVARIYSGSTPLYNVSFTVTVASNNTSFTVAPSSETAPLTVTFTTTYSAPVSAGGVGYKLDFGDGTTPLSLDCDNGYGTSVGGVPLPQCGTSRTIPHTYATAGTYTATVKSYQALPGATPTTVATVTVMVSGATAQACPTGTTGTYPNCAVIETGTGQFTTQVIVSVANIRATPSATGTIVGTQSSGARGEIVVAPVTADGYTWYRVDFLSGADGWTVASNIQPPANTPTATQECPVGQIGVFPNCATPSVSNAFTAGDRISTTGASNIRTMPSITGGIAGTQSVGKTGAVTAGPIAADGYVWWQVNFDSGVDGWTAESNIVAAPNAPVSSSCPEGTVGTYPSCASIPVVPTTTYGAPKVLNYSQTTASGIASAAVGSNHPYYCMPDGRPATNGSMVYLSHYQPYWAVYGGANGIYSTDSDLCASAVHAGVITSANGGTFVIQPVSAQAVNGTSANGIMGYSKAMGPAYKFTSMSLNTPSPAKISISPTSGISPLVATITITDVPLLKMSLYILQHFGPSGESMGAYVADQTSDPYATTGTKTITFYKPGVNTVKLVETVVGSGGGVTYNTLDTKTITVESPAASLSASVTNGMAPLLVNFSMINLDVAGGYSFDDGVSSLGAVAMPAGGAIGTSRRYTTPGTYTAKLLKGGSVISTVVITVR